MKNKLTTFLFAMACFANCSVLAQGDAIQIYSQDELLQLIANNTHLQQVKKDQCQLVKDIQARAEIVKLPSYQFLYGDMLAYGICVPRNAKYGIYMMERSAHQGLIEAIEQLGRYYHLGKFVTQDINLALRYLNEAASLGNLKAQMRLVKILGNEQGSPRDYENAYRWLHQAIISSDAQRKEAQALLNKLGLLMPQQVIARAKQPVFE